jgi:retinol dehydrogenase-12
MLPSSQYILMFDSRHFYFTQLLRPLLAAGAASSPDGKSRVINTASSASDAGTGVHFNTFRDGPARVKMGKYQLYCQSKLGNVLLSNAIARKWASDNIISMSLNPGHLKSELQRHTPAPIKLVLVSVISS